MLIIDIHANESPTLPECVSHELQHRYGVECLSVDASSVSSFTSMRIATVLKEHDVEAILCHRRKDLVGAVDAGKLIGNRRQRPYIIYVPQTEEALTEKLTKSTLAAVDAVVVSTESDKSRTNLPAGKIHVIEPSERAAQHNRPSPESERLTISWIGAIDDAERLDALVNTVHTTAPDAYSVHVFGTGSARFVMPIVRGARSMDGVDLTWHGTEYPHEEAFAATDVAVATSRIPTREHIQLLAAGIPVLESTAADFADKLTAIAADRSRLKQLDNEALNTYDSRFSPAVAADNWMGLLTTLRTGTSPSE